MPSFTSISAGLISPMSLFFLISVGAGNPVLGISLDRSSLDLGKHPLDLSAGMKVGQKALVMELPFRAECRQRVAVSRLTALLTVALIWSQQRRRRSSASSALAAEQAQELVRLIIAGKVLGEKVCGVDRVPDLSHRDYLGPHLFLHP